MRIRSIILTTWITIILTSCQSTYYKTMEVFGKQKKDLLVSKVASARDAQMDAKEQFASALDEFRSIVGYKGALLDEKYDALKAQYDKCEARTHTVENRIDDVKRVAKDLFREWEDELDQYSSPALRSSSEQKLLATQQRCEKVIGAMENARNKIYPVLNSFKDQVLFLKHNLNAQAVASLDQELDVIEREIAMLIREMESSMAQADSFIRQMQITE